MEVMKRPMAVRTNLAFDSQIRREALVCGARGSLWALCMRHLLLDNEKVFRVCTGMAA